MLAKFLTTVFILLNPFGFLFSQSADQLELPNQLGTEENQPIIQSLPEAASFNINLPISSADALSSFIISAAQGTNPDFLPIRDWNIEEPEIEAEAAIIVESTKDKILYQKNINQVRPIASLTKLMTALIILENLDLEEIVAISQKAIAAYGDSGNLTVNEKISVRNLLYPLLMESSNDAAIALAEALENSQKSDLGGDKDLTFLELMNKKAEELGLTKTHFVEPSGYQAGNLSTALDLAELVKYTLNRPFLWQILGTAAIDLPPTDNSPGHHLINTNQLLSRWPNIIGGKTGYTEEAQGCLVLFIEQPLDKMINYLNQDSSAQLIIIVLGAKDRFLETEKLINWVEQAYVW